MFEDQFDAQEIQAALPDYKFISRVGIGAFATVFLVEKKETHQLLALKKVSCFGMGEYQKAGAANQVRILSSLDHKNIIKVHSCLFDTSQDIIYIFMEYAQSGDLALLVEQARQRKKRIPESTIWKVICDVSDGLAYLHRNNIIHRDLKPANVFRTEKCFKIGDMNVSKVLKNGEAASTKTGSPYYTAPEVWSQSQVGYTNKCDIWSLGVVVYELCSLQVPFQGNSIGQINNKIKREKQNKNLPTFYSTSLNELVKRMLQVDEIKRVSAEEILKISGDKLKIELQQMEEKSVDTLMNTIVFPDTHQRWINLIPSVLPPKSSRREGNITARSKSKQKIDKQFCQNHSGIFRSNERRPILPKDRSKSKIQKSGDPKQQKSSILPPIYKNSPNIPKKSSQSKLQRSRSKQKRPISNSSRNERSSIINFVNETKTVIEHE